MENIKEAKNVYAALLEMLTDNNFHFEKDDENLSVKITMSGHDIGMDFKLEIDAERQLVVYTSLLPFKFKEDSIVAGAIAVCLINFSLADGSFDLDIRDGELSFKLTSSYMDSLLSKDALNYMFAMACMIVDRYNDRLVLVNEGLLNPFEVVEE